MTTADLYNNRELIETFTRSKTFETCRRLREQWPGFPQYQEQATEGIASWLIYIMAKTGRTTTKQAVYNAIKSGTSIKCGDEMFITWLGNLLLDPERIKESIISIWIYESADCVHVTTNKDVKIFQGKEKVKSVAKATLLSAQFLYDLAMNARFTDQNIDSEIVFEDNENNED
jgi:hypothetical protein